MSAADLLSHLSSLKELTLGLLLGICEVISRNLGDASHLVLEAAQNFGLVVVSGKFVPDGIQYVAGAGLS